MSFKYFRPWEDGWKSSTRQMTDRRHGSSAEASETAEPLHLHPGPIPQSEQGRSPSERATRRPHAEVEISGVLSDAKSTESIANDLNCPGPNFPSTEISSTRGSLATQDTRQDSSIAPVTTLIPDCASRSTDAGSPGKDVNYHGLNVSKETLEHSDNIENSTCSVNPGMSESHTTLQSISAIIDPAHTYAMQKITTQEVTFTYKSLNPSDDLSACGTSLRPDSCAGENGCHANCTTAMTADAGGNPMEIGQNNGLGTSSSVVNYKEAQSECWSLRSRDSEQDIAASKSKPMQCRICERAFSTSASLNRHKLSHTGSKPFQCRSCEMAFSHSSNLRRHEGTHTRSKPFQCRFCEKAFSQSSNLRTHERTHTESKPFQCILCDKAFSDSSNSRTHERTHTRSKPFQCRICEKAFSQSSTLRTHERTHTGSKPFQCGICEKAFSHCSTLRTHERTHTGSKPFQCRICGKAFSISQNLRRHERTHTGSKPFQCRICGKTFSQSSNLRRHERTHTESNLFKCRLCEKTFSQSEHLHRHERIHLKS